MKKNFFAGCVMAALVACTSQAVKSEAAPVETVGVKQRSEIPDKYKWNPSHLFKEQAAFDASFVETQALVDKLPTYKGKLADAAVTKEFAETFFGAMERLYALDDYAARNRDSDTTNTFYQGLYGKVEALYTKFLSAASFAEPEILALPQATVEGWKEKPEFAIFKRYLTNIVRWKPHTLTAEEEKVLANFSSVAYASYETYTTFTNADMPKSQLTLSTGEKIVVDDSMYVKYRTLNNRADRKALFETFWKRYDGVKNTASKMLNYQTKYYVTEANTRKFSSSLNKKLFEKELPPEFYEKLIAHVRTILPALHEYVALKKEILGVDKVQFYDMYVPLTNESSAKAYTYEESGKIISDAVTMMPEEFRTAIVTGMTPGSGWIDVYPSKGKADGGYCSSGTKATHPYVLLNWTEDYESLSTFAHEMGHAMHSYFSNNYQPYPTSQYNLFNAEVASIFNEMLLTNHLIKTAKTREEKIFILNHFIEMTRGTVFRQTLFAEFEKKFYDVVEKGEALTPDLLSKMYRDINNEYYGADKGLYNMEDLYAVEWSYIPHFYYNYYVFQYVVGFIGSLTLATKVIEGQIPAQQYVDGLLKAGSSKSPLDILKDAGVDMMSDEPYKLTERVFRERLAELKKLLKETPAK